MAIVFFDLDGTLLRGLSSEQRFIFYLLRKHVIGLRQIIAFLIFPLRWFSSFGMAVWKKNKAYLDGLQVNKIQSLSEHFAFNQLACDIRPSVKGLLEDHFDRGDMVILLTGAPDFIAYPVAKLLGIPHIAATICSTSNNRFTALPPRVHPSGKAKLQIATEICEKFGSTLSNSVAYADSGADIPLMSSVSKPIAIYPGRKLRRHAEKHGWQIIDH